ncbi:MAG: formylglycine-generating enzyme family protein [Anaerolineae bacterium]|nr:formylglycine-generating enzyme family protein [Anaerolineae bacterium]
MERIKRIWQKRTKRTELEREIHDVSDMLPAPFAWIVIPAGSVVIENQRKLPADRKYKVAAFQISKYPITNAQYTKFINAGGYHNRQWWTDAGWKARAEGWAFNLDRGWIATGKPWTEPRFWHDSQWNGKDHPVVGISWYEAVAFCQWLSEATGSNITLPTEQQWQHAAQGDDKRKYPWGNDWDSSRCNNSVSPNESQQTTSVHDYEGRGDSPFGVVDMTGNVWEWCFSEHEIPDNLDMQRDIKRKVLRGGSWEHMGEGWYEIANRMPRYPDHRNFTIGFRCSLTR